jgi:hypothetical protein
MAGFAASYPGNPEQIRHVRHDLAVALDVCPLADESILVVSELCANAAIATHVNLAASS